MRFWIAILITLLCSCLAVGSPLAGGSQQKAQVEKASAPVQMTSENLPEAFFPEANYTFEQVFEGAIVLHSFVLQNRGKATLEVKEVKTT